MLESFFDPKSVAIVGASPISTKVGNVIFHSIITNKVRGLFKGEVYAVNPKYEKVLGVKCHPSLKGVGGGVECVVVATPNITVPRVLEDASNVGAKAAIIISSGFGEAGETKLEDEVKKVARQGGIRVIGPNCLGVYDPYSAMDTLFVPEFKMLSTGREVLATPRPFRGPIVLISQSGALGVAALDYMAGHGMGVRCFVSLGNRCDVAEDELIDHFAQDVKTKVILLYVEGLGNGRSFYDAAQKATRMKPIVALKAGRTEAGVKAVASHTGALAGADRIYDAAFRQAGVIRVQNLEEFFDVGGGLSHQPPSKGENIAVLTNAGGPGILAADVCQESGLKVVDFSPSTWKKFEEMKARGELLPLMSHSNPLDVSALATTDMYARALQTLLMDPAVDGVVAIMLHHTPAIMDDVIDKIVSLSRGSVKPIVTCDIGRTEMAEEIRSMFEKHGIPACTTPERAARAMASLVNYGRYLRLKPTPPFLERIAAKRKAAIIQRILSEGRLNLLEYEASQLFQLYSIPMAESRLARTIGEAVKSAEEIGYPVAVKIASPNILHKSDAGCVVLNVKSKRKVEEAYRRVTKNAVKYKNDAEIVGVLIQEMAPSSTEVIVGMTRDQQFGPVVMFGLGGVFVEVLQDVSFRLAPVSRADAQEMIKEVRAYPLLTGVRGREPLDVDGVLDVILKISELAVEHEEISQLDLNPIFVYKEGVKAVDARVIL